MTSDWLRYIDPRPRVLWRGAWRAGTTEPARYLFDHELVCVMRGRCRMHCEDEVIDLGAGDFIVVPPGRRHSTVTLAGGVTRYCLHFDWTLSTRRHDPNRPLWAYHPRRPRQNRLEAAPDFVPNGWLRGRFAVDGSVPGLLETLFHRWQSNDVNERGLVRAGLLELLLRLFSSPGGRPTAPDRATHLAYAAKDAIDRDGEATGGIRELLESLGFSYAHVCRVFRRKFGVTPTSYRDARRLERAKILLREDRLTVAGIAHAVGFDDAGYFTRRFRSQNGVTPSAYRADT